MLDFWSSLYFGREIIWVISCQVLIAVRYARCLNADRDEVLFVTSSFMMK
jgi:hypothetical protein